MRKLSELLPYDPSVKTSGEMKKGLHEYLLLLSKLLKAIENFQNGHFEKFDSLVGENGCHIRAIKIALLAMQGLDLDSLKKKTTSVCKRIDELLDPKLMVHLSIKKVSLADLFREEDLEVHLSDDMLFLFKSYLLTEVKEDLVCAGYITSLVGNSISTAENLMCPNRSVSVKFVKKLTDKIRNMLSFSSVKFVREIAECKDIQRMVSDEFFYLHNSNLACTPLFWTIKALLQKTHKENIPIILHIKFINQEANDYYKINSHEYLFFKPSLIDGQMYAEASLMNEDLDKPACVIEGITFHDAEELKKMLDHLSLLDIILANCAAHRQYPDPNQDEQFIAAHHPEYQEYKRLAIEKGFSLQNPSSFLIQHIYSSQPKRFFETV